MQANPTLDVYRAVDRTGPWAYGLALAVHVLLVLALTWGVSWHRQDRSPAIEAELWSAVPLEAAPRAVEPEPQPEPEPSAPPPPEKVEPARPSEADIALARERERKDREAALQAEQQRQKAARERQEKAEQAQKAEREKKEAAERQRKDAEDKARKQKELEAKRKDQAAEAEREKLRQENLKRIQGLAGATGAPGATGTAQKSTGLSANYKGRIIARVKPNIVFTDSSNGNPEAVVQVRASPDGTIIGRTLVKSSGVPNWDDAVLKAIDKTEILPRNEDGIVPSPIEITFRPKD